MFRVTPSARDSFGTLKAPSSHPTLMLRVGVPLEEGTVPSGRQHGRSDVQDSCTFVLIRGSNNYSRQFVVHSWPFMLKKKSSRSTIASVTSDFVYKFELDRVDKFKYQHEI